MNGAITGQWNDVTGEVSWHLDTTHVYLNEALNQVPFTNRVDGTGRFTANDTATGSATWTTSVGCVELSANGSGRAGFTPYEGTGTVEWFMVFTK